MTIFFLNVWKLKRCLPAVSEIYVQAMTFHDWIMNSVRDWAGKVCDKLWIYRTRGIILKWVNCQTINHNNNIFFCKLSDPRVLIIRYVAVVVIALNTFLERIYINVQFPVTKFTRINLLTFNTLGFEVFNLLLVP